MLTDNAGAYRSRPWRTVCARNQLRRRFTRPYRPQTNGKAEALIKTLTREWAYRFIAFQAVLVVRDGDVAAHHATGRTAQVEAVIAVVDRLVGTDDRSVEVLKGESIAVVATRQVVLNTRSRHVHTGVAVDNEPIVAVA